MIENFFMNLEKWSNHFPFGGYEVIAVFAFIESLAFLGVLFPGSFIMVLFGYLCYLKHFDIFLVFSFVCFGALFGDLFSYWLGKKKGLDIKLGKSWIFNKIYFPEAGDYLLKKGPITVVLGRFIGPTRAFVPFYLGAAGQEKKRFLVYDIVGVIFWAVAYLMLGYIFGGCYDSIKNFIKDIDFFVILAFIFVVSPYLFIKIMKKKIIKI